MENITNHIKECMNKTYTFNGKQLTVAALGILVVFGIAFCTGRDHGGPRDRDFDREGGRKIMMQKRQWNRDNQGNQNNQNAMMNNQTPNNQHTITPAQQTPSPTSTGSSAQ